MYYIVYGLLYLLSLLPLKVLYLLSDLAYIILYRITGYRKTIVFQNLDIAFPQKTHQEKKIIAKKFYRNFCDTFIETIKLIISFQIILYLTNYMRRAGSARYIADIILIGK
jgi:KDO2-lipid IV(A) lauroyltransferase